MFTEYKIYCAACGVRFLVKAGGMGGYGRHMKCCSRECLDRLELWDAKSLLGKQVEQE